MKPEFALITQDYNPAPGKIETPVGKVAIASCVPDYSKKAVLLDGTPITIRPICSGDKEALQAFHNRLSQETRFLRYHYSKGQLTESDLKSFCDVDYYNDLGLVAEVERNGHQEIIGVGRFSRLPIKHTAEIAFVVQDSEQNKGLGTLLLRHIATLAWQRDIYFFFGELLRHNSRMLSILRKSDPEMKQEIDSPSTCTITLSVAEAMQRGP